MLSLFKIYIINQHVKIKDEYYLYKSILTRRISEKKSISVVRFFYQKNSLFHKLVTQFAKVYFFLLFIVYFLKCCLCKILPYAFKYKDALKWSVLPFLKKCSSDKICVFHLDTLEHHVISPAMELTIAEDLELDIPRIYPAFLQKELYPSPYRLVTPGVKMFSIQNVMVAGKCDFIFVDKHCLHHEYYQFDRDFTPEEMHGLIQINIKRNTATLYMKENLSCIPVYEKAIFLIGSASCNYVHWLTETAPKLALIDRINTYADYPLLVDAGLHPNILSSLNILNSQNRPIIFLNRHQFCHVRHLIILSPVAYVPFEYRQSYLAKKIKIEPNHALYIPEPLRLMRELVLRRSLPLLPKPSMYILIRRNAQSRHIHNMSILEATLVSKGFQIVEPEKLSFTEQVRLFSSAKTIMAQAGASLGNIIFAHPGCHVIILSAWSPYNNYYYFSNIAHILGLKCTYLMGKVNERSCEAPAHRSFSVDIHLIDKLV